MKQRLVVLVAVVFLAALAATASADVLWGVTNGTYGNGFWTGGEIFTVESGTGAVQVKARYTSADGVYAFGDIALSPSGEVYASVYGPGTDGFDRLVKVNTTTWGFDWVQDLGAWNDQVNALTFIGDTMYGVTGGGTPADLRRFTLSPGGATVTNLGNIGFNSDGDLAWNGSQLYYTSWETGSFGELNVIQFGPPPSKTGIETNGSGWAGLVFDEAGTLFAGTWQDEKLYTLNPATGVAAPVFDLSGDLGGTITGLDRPIPEPATLTLLGLGLLGAGATARRRRR